MTHVAVAEARNGKIVTWIIGKVSDERYDQSLGEGAQGRSRTTDTAIFSRMLYQLSYLGTGRSGVVAQPRHVIKRLRARMPRDFATPRPRFRYSSASTANGSSTGTR